MEIGVASRGINFSNDAPSNASQGQTRALNAYGIGSANQPEVQLSPQARILQQNEQTQNQRAESLTADKKAEKQPESVEELARTDFIRVSSSVGAAAKNNLTSEQATEVYRSIQELL
ncbi:hypothetical protein [Aliiglaciecola sp. LCG003]|uniref:hypothetical protein n=1 Tax=Aliiglaciecola sp. LCG003 TaxID=3053655 RepID=UPI0025732FBF|nr:hypothetical protein [Aliiglaciecola sp. LCG003]WJG09019.1 hypothetical protein QR722_17065 [Aliiglaciecola sp. LCG003]